MKDFDQERADRGIDDRQFRIAGEVLTRRVSVRPEAIVAYNELTPLDEDSKALDVVDSTIRSLLEPDSVVTWDALRTIDDERAITTQDMGDIIRWALEGMTRRPPDRQPGSSDGPSDPAGTPSTGASASVAGRP